MKRLLSAIETVAAFFLLAIALVTATNVVVRAAFATQIPDWFDGSRLLLGIALFWGIAVATYHAGHICVDAVWELLAERGRRRMDTIAAAVTLVFMVPMAWMVLNKVLGSGTQTTTDLRLPVMAFTLVAGLGAVAAAVLAAARLLALLRGVDPHADPLPDAEAAPGTGPGGSDGNQSGGHHDA